MRTLSTFALAALAAVVTLSAGAGAQKKPLPPVSLAEQTASERALIAGSREAIIKSGISPDFFDEHFHLARVIDRPGDRRVVWLLAVGGHEATVNDSIGFYTEGARRVDTHSVATTLPRTSDIKRTITRRRAETLMRRCIGRFTNPQVEYRAHGAEGRAALLLTAQTTVPRRREEHEREGRGREARERREREEREREERERRARAQAGGLPSTDVVEEEDEEGEGPVIKLGAVNLVTGECSVGYGQAGPVPPAPARPGRRQR